MMMMMMHRRVVDHILPKKTGILKSHYLVAISYESWTVIVH